MSNPSLLEEKLNQIQYYPLNNGDEEINLESHREGTTTFFKTFFNGLNALSGVGLLSIPYALSSGGWLSLIFFFIVAATTFFTGLLIRRCMDIDKKIRTYPDIGARAFGNIGRVGVTFLCYLELCLVATGFLILEGDNLHNLFSNMQFHYSWIHLSGKAGFVILVGLIILPSVWIRDLNKLSYVSTVGLLACLVVIGAILWTGAFGGVGFHEKGRILNLTRIPTAFSLYTFCYSAHPIFPTLYTSMKDKSQFNKVLFLCFFVCTTGYASMAILGYMMYGENVNSQVTLNLPVKQICSKIAIYTILIIPIAKYAIIVTPVASSIENRFAHNKTYVMILIRTMLLISTVVVAVAVPFFGDLVSLVGSLLNASASIILPCVCYLKMSRIYKRWSYELVIIIGILLMGFSVVIFGTYTSATQLIDHWHENNMR
ncbi:hypothetical protein ACHQM5_008559 [Ranunculus cassubicifolius]